MPEIQSRSEKPALTYAYLTRPSFDPLLSMFGDRKSSMSSSVSERPQQQHKRSSSLMDMAPSIARFVNQISTADDNRVFSPSSFFASLAGPEIPERENNKNTRNDEYIQQQQRQLARQHHQQQQHRFNSSRSMPHPPLPEEHSEGGEEDNEDDDDEEDLFDFSKMIAVGKNVRTFGEDVMGSGLRMFNDMANRVRNASRQQQQQQQQYQVSADPEEEEGWSLGREAWL